MAQPAITFNGHFDGNVIVLNEPLSLPKDAEVRVRLEVLSAGSPERKKTIIERFDRLSGSIGGVVVPDDAYDRGHLYRES